MRIILGVFAACFLLTAMAVAQSNEYGECDRVTYYKLLTTPYGPRLVESDSVLLVYFPQKWRAIKLINTGEVHNTLDGKVRHYDLRWETLEKGKIAKHTLLYLFFGQRRIVWFKYPEAVFPKKHPISPRAALEVSE